MSELVPENKQLEIDMLLQVDTICSKHNIPFYLAYGTALGAVRHNAMIPWDTDIDIMVPINVYDDFIKSLVNNLSTEYTVRYFKNDRQYEYLHARVSLSSKEHHLVHIDVFPMIGTSRNSILQRLAYNSCLFLNKVFYIKRVSLNNTRKLLQVRLLKPVAFFIPESILIMVYEFITKHYPYDKSEIIFNSCGSYGNKEIIRKEILGTPIRKMFEGYLLPIPQKWHEYLTIMYGDYMIPDRRNPHLRNGVEQ